MSPQLARFAAIVALVVAALAVVVLLAQGSSETLNAHFTDAGGLITGDRVEVAGRKVGTISAIDLTPDGQVDVVLSISDSSVLPLHQGTRASIRAVGQAGITNRYIALTPGPATMPTLANGAVLSTAQTSGIVDIDAILDSFGPAQRANLQQLIANSAQVYAGSGAGYFNQTLGELEPALAALNTTTGQLAFDQAALGTLIRTGAVDAQAVASRQSDLVSAVQSTAGALGALARERAALTDSLSRMPTVLAQARGTLSQAGTALTALRPALRDVGPVSGPLYTLLSRADATLPAAGAAIANLNAQLPAIDSSLAGLKPLGRVVVPALRQTGVVMKGLFPIFEGLRYYGSDLVLGILSGIVGAIGGEYDADGHYAKALFVESPQLVTSEGGLNQLLGGQQLPGGVLGIRTGLLRRCPGGDEPPAPDGSSPWVLPKQLCTSSDDIPASVDTP